jgi:hypothetical protein
MRIGMMPEMPVIGDWRHLQMTATAQLQALEFKAKSDGV